MAVTCVSCGAEFGKPHGSDCEFDLDNTKTEEDEEARKG